MRIGDHAWICTKHWSHDNRHDWIRYYIIAETSKSWLLHENKDAAVDKDNWGVVKVAKKPLPEYVAVGRPDNKRRIVYSDQELDNLLWVSKHRVAVVRLVERVDNYHLLQEIGRLVGYKSCDNT
jgi:hypothetical protein